MGANYRGFVKVPDGRYGYGQVEPTHLSGQRTSQIYAQLPADDFDLLENGQFVKYDYSKEKCCLPKDGAVGEWMLVWNEIKLYDEREQMYKDYAMVKTNFTPGSDSIQHDGTGFAGYGPFKGQMVPRVMKTNVGDIMITNTLVQASASNYDANDYSKVASVFDTDGKCKHDAFTPDDNTGYLIPCAIDEADAEIIWAVDKTKAFTMPDGQPAVKIQRIK